jgi:hypothetical protein
MLLTKKNKLTAWYRIFTEVLMVVQQVKLCSLDNHGPIPNRILSLSLALKECSCLESLPFEKRNIIFIFPCLEIFVFRNCIYVSKCIIKTSKHFYNFQVLTSDVSYLKLQLFTFCREQ